MEKIKVCNQHMVKDSIRNKKYTGTIKCVACEDESNLQMKLPISVYDYIEYMKAFIKLHSMFGCNKVKLPVPDWASSDMSVGISLD